jgi:hypothetical protein
MCRLHSARERERGEELLGQHAVEAADPLAVEAVDRHTKAGRPQKSTAQAARVSSIGMVASP